MASPATRAPRNALKLTRSCERSRLDKQVIATAYELATPLVRRPIVKPSPGPQPAFAGPARKIGGSRA
jgi:hypothetical protein